MITSKQLEEMRKTDLLSINPDDLVDINDVVIQTDLPKEERIADFIRQIKNPYFFKCGNIVVECIFSQAGPTLEERMNQIIDKI